MHNFRLGILLLAAFALSLISSASTASRTLGGPRVTGEYDYEINGMQFYGGQVRSFYDEGVMTVRRGKIVGAAFGLDLGRETFEVFFDEPIDPHAEFQEWRAEGTFRMKDLANGQVTRGDVTGEGIIKIRPNGNIILIADWHAEANSGWDPDAWFEGETRGVHR